MHWIAAIVATLAVIVFACAYLSVSRKWANTNLGLALLTAAWMIQLILVSGKHLTID